jgi:alcohol dehydrogenase class IV
MSRCVAPDISLTDPDTLRTLPDEHVGSTAIDALSHAVEAYFSLASSTLTDVNALRALTLLNSSFTRAIRERNPRDMENLARASLLAGMAFSNSLLGIGHALAHPIGGLYDVNHGSVNAVLLPEVLRYDFPVVREKLPEMAVAFGHAPENDYRVVQEMTLDTIATLLEAAGSPGSLRSLGVQEDDLLLLAQRAFRDVCLLTSPRETDVDDLLALLKRAF